MGLKAHFNGFLIIAKYKKQLQKIKSDQIGNITYSGEINYIEIEK